MYICETFHKHLHESEIPCQLVYNNLVLNPVPNELNNFEEIESVLIFKRMLFKKIAKIQAKGEFSNNNGNIPTEAANTCNILWTPELSNRLIVVRLKWDLI